MRLPSPKLIVKPSHFPENKLLLDVKPPVCIHILDGLSIALSKINSRNHERGKEKLPLTPHAMRLKEEPASSLPCVVPESAYFCSLSLLIKL
ncbi:hypothetical protein V6N12_023096 [Hibiscus sabdariffa]|uniref:Uncharacterized protein n=1 Tax=Hibiscus sabdariffa TaxID=183260 RepID=A0ABR2FX35_9ROSI